MRDTMNLRALESELKRIDFERGVIAGMLATSLTVAIFFAGLRLLPVLS